MMKNHILNTMIFNQSDFNEFILTHNVIGFFEEPITLKSGKQSNFYVNWRPITSDVSLLEKTAHFIIDFCNNTNLKPDCFYGVPEGATKLGVITQYIWAKTQHCVDGSHCLPMGRSKPKQHGNPLDKFFVGAPKGSVILLEDVTTTGQSMLDTLDELQALDIKVIACIGLTNREPQSSHPTVKEKVEKRGIPYYALSTAKPLLTQLIKKKKTF